MTTVAVPQTKRSRSEFAELAWVWSVVGYTVLRFAIAWGAFSEHGANVWIFGLLDVGTAWPYAKAVAAVCRRAANAQWMKLPVPLAIALVSFAAPYVYLWFAAGSMPDGVRAGFVICVSVLFLAATAGVLSKSRKLRRALDADTSAIDTTARDDGFIDLRGQPRTLRETELIIDLTGPAATIERATVDPTSTDRADLTG